MDIKTLEKRLKKLYAFCLFHYSKHFKKDLHSRVVAQFQKKHQHAPYAFSGVNLWLLRFSKLAFVSALFVVFINLFSFLSTQTLAGEVLPTNGAVKIIRNNESFLVNENFELKEGDIVQVGNGAEAEIFFQGEFKSIIKPHTEIRIINHNEIFIERGEVINASYDHHQFTAERGFVEGSSGSEFIISVSESGEMQVISQKNKIHVFDWKSGEMTLDAGQKINLRTDTHLQNIPSLQIPKNISLSARQLQSIQAKLIITRTKLLTTIEKITLGNRSGSQSDLLSAKKTFMSLYDILFASRDLSLRTQTHWESLSFADIMTAMKDRGVPEDLIKEAQALQTLFTIVEENRNHIAFSIEETPLNSYNRFVTLDRIFKDQNPLHAQILKNKYVAVFLRDILNHPLRIDQVSFLNENLKQLPHNENTKDFLIQLKQIIHPDIVPLLEEKIQKDF